MRPRRARCPPDSRQDGRSEAAGRRRYKLCPRYKLWWCYELCRRYTLWRRYTLCRRIGCFAYASKSDMTVPCAEGMNSIIE